MAAKPEILAPAGDMEKLTMALRYGADAVYLGGKAFGMRAAAGNFDREELQKALAMCRAAGAKMYVTCNVIPGDADMAALPEYFAFLASIGADAVVVTDMGVFSLARRYAPGVPVHISTQAGIMNSEAANMWRSLGASRVILARELSLEAVAEIRRNTPPELEIEAFVHGSMCVSFSGRCLLSDYLASRGANMGACAQPCRWTYYLMEEKRPGQYFQITEDGGTHIFNSKDMCTIDRLGDLMSAGIDSFKIEGRQKSSYYAAVITNAYKKARDAVLAGGEVPRVWIDEVNKVSHREYSGGFWFGGSPGEHYEDSSYIRSWEISAVVESCLSDGTALLSQRNRVFEGDRMELLTPDGEPREFTMGAMQTEDGEKISSTPHPMMRYRAKLPLCAPPLSIIRKQNQ